ncbi:curli assembly protein CsgF [Massilia sp. TW-1]|uniref:Curli production assembly/transport component CsgF n=1 Tax=Telluria antibiotica TaxID=2717319 RepID=A0ABX0PB42_9BURK|nr:curli assembly protein CsgF [Telluria antibiotica]NIA53365.1 curli assembly protein CsgF [Telluria antibiotica]
MLHSLSPHLACCLALWGAAAGASELVYVPVNPSFGGSPSNGPGLLASASATNKHGSSGLGGSSPLNQSPLQQFNETLERMMLSQLASAATSKLMGTDGKLLPGTFSTENFVITVTDLGGGLLRVTTTDKSTGAVTSFEVGQ